MTTVKRILGCYRCFTHAYGREYDHTTITGHLRYVIRDRFEALKDWPRDFLRWTVAGWLCWLACKCRGQRWYVGDNWAGVPGNRAAELKQAIFEECVTSYAGEREEFLSVVEPKLDELAQLAGEAWGHIQPKEPRRDEKRV